MKKTFVILVTVVLLVIMLTACNASKKDAYTLIFADTNYGAVTYEEGEQIIKPADPTKEGYTFEGWFSNAESTVPFVFGTMPKADTTVYAKWKEIPSYSFTYIKLNEYFGAINLPVVTQKYLKEDGEFRDAYAITAVDLANKTDIEIPSEYNGLPVNVIGYGLFEGSDITKVTIPASIVYMDGQAFRNCASLSEVAYEENSKMFSFGSEVFFGCSALTELTLPPKLTLIGIEPFAQCRNLKTVYVEHKIDYRNGEYDGEGNPNPDFEPSEPSWMGTHGSDGMFNGCMNLESIYVYRANGNVNLNSDPPPSEDRTGLGIYKGHLYWSNYAQFIKAHPSGK